MKIAGVDGELVYTIAQGDGSWPNDFLYPEQAREWLWHYATNFDTVRLRVRTVHHGCELVSTDNEGVESYEIYTDEMGRDAERERGGNGEA